MEVRMKLNLWSDEDRLFIPRTGGWSINFKYFARKLRWVKPLTVKSEAVKPDSADEKSETSEDRLRRSVDRSRFEDN
jgi:hypothetical protein